MKKRLMLLVAFLWIHGLMKSPGLQKIAGKPSYSRLESLELQKADPASQKLLTDFQDFEAVSNSPGTSEMTRIERLDRVGKPKRQPGRGYVALDIMSSLGALQANPPRMATRGRGKIFKNVIAQIAPESWKDTSTRIFKRVHKFLLLQALKELMFWLLEKFVPEKVPGNVPRIHLSQGWSRLYKQLEMTSGLYPRYGQSDELYHDRLENWAERTRETSQEQVLLESLITPARKDILALWYTLGSAVIADSKKHKQKGVDKLVTLKELWANIRKNSAKALKTATANFEDRQLASLLVKDWFVFQEDLFLREIELVEADDGTKMVKDIEIVKGSSYKLSEKIDPKTHKIVEKVKEKIKDIRRKEKEMEQKEKEKKKLAILQFPTLIKDTVEHLKKLERVLSSDPPTIMTELEDRPLLEEPRQFWPLRRYKLKRGQNKILKELIASSQNHMK